MKIMRPFLVLLVSLVFAAGLSAQTILGWGVDKQVLYTQNSISAPTLQTNPYGISAFVFGTGLAGTYSFTPPNTGTVQTAQVITGGMLVQGNFANITALNAAFGNGTYSMALPNSTVTQSVSFNLSGDTYRAASTITGGTWSSGLLQIDPTQNYFLTFTTPGFVAGNGTTTEEDIHLQINNAGNASVFTQDYAGGTAMFTINAGTLLAGQTYTGSLRFNHNGADIVSIPGATGNFGYSTETDFQIRAFSAIPEPSTYALILIGVVQGGVMFHRRRRAASLS